jgi:hypothetical protein
MFELALDLWNVWFAALTSKGTKWPAIVDQDLDRQVVDELAEEVVKYCEKRALFPFLSFRPSPELLAKVGYEEADSRQ